MTKVERRARRLAAAVQREPAHLRAELEFAKLRRRRDDLRARMNSMPSTAHLMVEPPAVRRLADELEDIERQFKASREALTPHRAEHAARVKGALKQPAIEAAKKAVDAIEKLEAAIGELNALRAEIRAAGEVAPPISVTYLATVSAPLRQIAHQERPR